MRGGVHEGGVHEGWGPFLFTCHAYIPGLNWKHNLCTVRRVLADFAVCD